MDISVVIPLFNEEESLPELCSWIDKVMKENDFSYEVLLIDDISYVPFERQETDVLFTLLSERYEMRSVLITSNLPFSKWNTVFKDEMTTNAAVDRLVHHSVILELNTSSYRSDAALQARKTVTTAETTT